MRRPIVESLVVLSLVALTACSREARPPAAPAAASGGATASGAATPASSVDSSTRGTVAISDEIRKACGIGDEDEYFAFDSARIDAHARGVLDKLAKCFDNGPLSSRVMHLVGRADPRGDEEYNMLLGDRRASSVRTALVQLGMREKRITSTSRGALDATGTDAAGWAKDRRVDVMLGS